MTQLQGQDPKRWRWFHLCFFGFFFFHGIYTAIYFGWPAVLDAMLATACIVLLYVDER